MTHKSLLPSIIAFASFINFFLNEFSIGNDMKYAINITTGDSAVTYNMYFIFSSICNIFGTKRITKNNRQIKMSRLILIVNTNFFFCFLGRFSINIPIIDNMTR